MATTYYDPDFDVYALQARTDAVPAAVDDVNGEDLRTILELFTEGIVGANSYVVAQNSAGASMNVEVGSGVADSDKAIIAGDESGQGNYLARMVDASDLLTVPAADLSNPRIDEVYLVIQDTAYDSSTFVKPRLAYRDGTPALSPSAPGPDAGWDAFLLLASIAVAAGATEIEEADITDERVIAASVVPPSEVEVEVGGATDVVGDGTITVTFKNGASTIFTMPSHWGSYKIIAWGSVEFNLGSDSSSGSTRVSIDGDTGTAVSTPTSTQSDPFNVPATAPARHDRTGLTANATVVIQYNETAAAIAKIASVVNYIAVRTS